jgi:putative heme-binding domain-containing protein
VREVAESHRIRLLAATAMCAEIFLGLVLPAQAEDRRAAIGDSGGAIARQIKEGASLFRANCSPCHGLNARGGGRGPDLTSGQWLHGVTDATIYRTISQGIPGTEMPANNFEHSETQAIVAYLTSLRPSSKSVSAGDRTRGEEIFLGKGACSGCHTVRGKGGGLGPDLSRVGAARSESYLIDSIREPSRELSIGMVDPNNPYGNVLVYDTVTIMARTGRITGIAKNDDTFSIQLLDTSQQLHLLLKKDLESVTHEHKSLMPAYTEQVLSDAELQDLIAYLESLRGRQ